MVKHSQTIRRQDATNCLNVFENFVGLALQGLTSSLANVSENRTARQNIQVSSF